MGFWLTARRGPPWPSLLVYPATWQRAAGKFTLGLGPLHTRGLEASPVRRGSDSRHRRLQRGLIPLNARESSL